MSGEPLPAIGESPAYLALIRETRGQHQDEEALDALLWLIGAHPLLIGHAQIFENIKALVARPTFTESQLSWAGNWTDSLDRIRGWLAWFSDQRSNLEATPGLARLFEPPTNKAAHPLVGQHVDRHPVAAALWNRVNGPEDVREAYMQLQGHVLAMYAESRVRSAVGLQEFLAYRGAREFGATPMNAGPVGRAVRELADIELATSLVQLPPRSSTQQFATAIRLLSIDYRAFNSAQRARIGEAMGAVVDYFKALPALLTREGLHPRTRQAGRGRQAESYERPGHIAYAPGSSVLVTQPNCGDDSTPLIEVAFVPAPELGDDSTSLEGSGLSPVEVVEPILTLREYDALVAMRSSMSFQRSAAELRSQPLACSVDQASAADLHAICLAFRLAQSNAASAVRGQRTSRLQALKGALLVKTMFVLGVDSEQARSMAFEFVDCADADTIDRLVNRPIERLHLLAQRTPDADPATAVGFLIPGLSPVYKTALEPHMAAIGRSRHEALLLPDMTGLGQELLELARDQERATRTGDSVFGMEPKTAQNAIRDFLLSVESALRPVDSNPDRSRLTSGKITRALRVAIAELSGDPVASWLICWQTNQQNEARLFYTQYPAEQLTRLYLKALYRILPRGEQALTRQRRGEIPPAPCLGRHLDQFVGARFVARREAVANLVQRLRRELENQVDVQRISEIVGYHNRYVLYTWLMQALRTSLRAIASPVALLDAVERTSLALNGSALPPAIYTAISDKSGGFEDRARLVELKGDLLQQLSNFRTHAAVVVARLDLFAEWSLGTSAVQRLFALDDNAKPIAVTPTWVEDKLAKLGFPAPANFSRGFLRTELLMAGCPGQSIDAFLGHFGLGENPASRHASLDWSQHLAVIRHYVRAVLHGFDLTQVRSKLIPAAYEPGRAPWQLPPADTKRLALPPMRFTRKLPGDAPVLPTQAASALWSTVSQEATEQDRRQAPALLHFLKAQDNPHATLLLHCDWDRPTPHADETSARQLEALVLEQCLKRRLTRLNVMHWLRLLHGAERRLRAAGHDIALTRLAYVSAEMPSAFGARNTWSLSALGAWREALTRWVLRLPERRPRPLEWCAALAISAITGGMMLDRTMLRRWLEDISSEGNRCIGTAEGHGYFRFTLPSSLASGVQTRYWFPDTLTELLFLRMPTMPVSVGLNELRQPMRDLLLHADVPPEWIPRSWSPIFRAARTYWSTQVPQFLVQAMQRGLATEALRPDSWSRILRCDLLSLPTHGRLLPDTTLLQSEAATLGAPEPASEIVHESASVSGSSEEADRERDPLVDDVVAAHPWLADLDGLLDTDDSAQAAEKLDQMRLRLDGHPTAQLYVSWLATSIGQHSSPAPDRTDRTARGVGRNLLRLVPHLLLEFGDTWPGAIEPQERRDRLRRLVHEAGDDVSTRDIAAMISNLEERLSDGAAAERAWYDDVGIDGDDWPRVDARILTLDHFEGALELARLGIEPAIPPDEREALQVAMTVAGRSGLRPTEWLGLRLVDLSDVKGLELLVRPHAERPLKSDNAERRVPLSSFLTSRERHLIRRWLGRRLTEVQHLSDEERQRAPLLHLDKWPDAQARARVLLRHVSVLLRQATGDPSIRPYALRHMFCSWTCLALTAADSLALPTLLNQWPATVAWLRRGSRMRQHLLARNSGPERRSLYLLCRLMGHMSPAITLAHYTHIVDLLQFEAVQQQCPQVQRGVLVAASGLPKSTAHDRLARSLGSLVEATREATLAMPVPVQPAWPVHDPLEMSSPRWNRDKVRSVLAAYLESGQPPATIANRFGITPDQLDRMVRTSAELGPLFGEPLQAALAPNLGTTCCPPRGRLGASQRATANELFACARELFERDARLCMTGVRLHLQHYTRDVHDIAFTEPDPLRTYVEFLQALGIEPARVQVCLRRASAVDHDLPAWACDQLGPFGSSLVWCIRPRSTESAVGYSRWLGLKIFDSGGQGCGIWLARTLMYAAIACEATSGGPTCHIPLNATLK